MSQFDVSLQPVLSGIIIGLAHAHGNRLLDILHNKPGYFLSYFSKIIFTIQAKAQNNVDTNFSIFF